MTDFIAAAMVVLIGIFGILFISFLLSWPLMLLWNYCLVGAIAGVNQVGWLQMWGISVLFACLFKSVNTTTSK